MRHRSWYGPACISNTVVNFATVTNCCVCPRRNVTLLGMCTPSYSEFIKLCSCAFPLRLIYLRCKLGAGMILADRRQCPRRVLITRTCRLNRDSGRSMSPRPTTFRAKTVRETATVGA